MTGNERESQLSAMFDGELPAEECELLARRLSRDEDMRRSYAHYALIGSVIRNEPIASHEFATKINQALRTTTPLPALGLAAGTAHATAPQSGALPSGDEALPAANTQTGLRRWLWPVSATGLAASVAAIALLSLEPAALQGPQAWPEQAATPATGTVVEEVVTNGGSLPEADPAALVAEVIIPVQPQSNEPESYATPPADGAAGPRLASAVQLANFVVAHGTVSVPMMRHSALSVFITDQGEAEAAPSEAAPSQTVPSEAAAQ